MANLKKKVVELSPAHKLGLGIGLTAAAVAAAGAFFLYGSDNAPENRKKVKGWMLKAKGEVLEKLEQAKHMTEGEFKEIVDGVALTYEKAQALSKKELSNFKKEMAENWQELVASGIAKVLTTEQIMKSEAKGAKQSIKKVVAKAAKKEVEKSAKKVVNKVAKKVAKKTAPKKA